MFFLGSWQIVVRPNVTEPSSSPQPHTELSNRQTVDVIEELETTSLRTSCLVTAITIELPAPPLFNSLAHMAGGKSSLFLAHCHSLVGACACVRDLVSA